MIQEEQIKRFSFKLENYDIYFELKENDNFYIRCEEQQRKNKKSYYENVFTSKSYKQQLQVSFLYPTFQRLYKQLVKKSNQNSLKFVKSSIQFQVKIDDQINIYNIPLNEVDYRKLEKDLMNKNQQNQLEIQKFLLQKQNWLKNKEKQILHTDLCIEVDVDVNKQKYLAKQQAKNYQQFHTLKPETQQKTTKSNQQQQQQIFKNCQRKQDNNQKLKQLIHKLQQKLKLQHKIGQIQLQTIDKLKKQSLTLQEEISSLKNKYKMQLKNMDQLNQKNQSFQNMLQQKQSQNYKNIEFTQKVTKQNSQLKEKLQILQKELNQKEYLKNLLKQEQAQLQQKSLQLQKLVKQNQKNIELIAKLQNQLASLKKKLQQIEIQSSQQKNKYEQKLKEKEDQFQQLVENYRKSLQTSRQYKKMQKNKINKIDKDSQIQIQPTGQNKILQKYIFNKLQTYQIQKQQNLNVNANNMNCIKLIQLLQKDSNFFQLYQLKEQLVQKRCLQIQDLTLLQFKSLKKMTLYQSLVDDKTLKKICRLLPQLEEMYGTMFSQVKKISISNCYKLKKLYLSHCRADIYWFQQLPLLQEVRIIDCKLIKSIKFWQCSKIKKLQFHNFYINDLQLQEALNQLPNLQTLKLGYNQVLKKLKLTNLKKLYRLQLTHTSLTLLKLQNLQQFQQLFLEECKQLKQMKLENCQQIKVTNLKSLIIDNQTLSNIIKNASNLVQLTLYWCQNIKEVRLQNLNSLKKVIFSKIELTTCVFKSLSNLEQILWENSFLSSLKEFKIVKCQKFNKLLLGSSNLSPQFQSLINQLMLDQSSNLYFQLKGYANETAKQVTIKNISKLKKLNILRSGTNSLIFQPNQIEELYFYQNLQLKSIKIEHSYQSLKRLQFNHSFLNDQNLFSTLSKMPNLQQLKITTYSRDNKIFQIPSNLIKLKKIFLHFAYPIKINCNFLVNKSFIEQLEQLSIINCKFQKNHQIQIKNFTQLRNLTIISISQILQEFSIQNIANLKQLKVNCKKFSIKNCESIQKIFLTLQSSLSQEDIQLLIVQMPNLTEFTLNSNFIKQIKLTKLIKLQKLTLPASVIKFFGEDLLQLTDIALPQVLGYFSLHNCPKVKILYFGGSNCYTNPRIQKMQLKGVQSLTQINLLRCKGLKQIVILGKCQKLTKLNLNQTCITQTCLQQICFLLTQLQQLSIFSDKIKKLKLTNNRKLKKFLYSGIKYLHLQNLLQLRQLSTQYQVKLINCPKIRKLNFQYNELNDKQLQQILYQKQQVNSYFNVNVNKINQNQQSTLQLKCKFPLLTELNLSKNKNVNFTKLQLKNLNKLHKLSAVNTQIQTLILEGLPQLRQLNLNYQCKSLKCITIKNCQKLQKLSLESLPITTLQLSNLSQISQLTIRSNRNLQQIKLQKCQKITKINLYCSNISAQQLQKLCISLPNLEYLGLDNCQNLKQYQIKSCKSLKYLNLRYSKFITDAKLFQFLKSENLQELQELILYGCGLLKQLKLQKRTNLKKLDLSYTQISDKQLVELSDNLPSLQQISLFTCKQIKDPVKSLNSFKKLKKINVEQAIMSDLQVTQMKKLNPNIQVSRK